MKKLLAALLLACVGTAAFAYGPLLPWSPVKPGYETASFARARIFFAKSGPLLDDYRAIDQMMAEAEQFHRLRFRSPVSVIACKSWGDCERGLPWLSVRGLGGITLATGDVIYITPKLAERHFHTGEFLRHELSHALLSQNTTMLKTHQLNDSPWFFEGLAVSFGRQQDFFTREQFHDLAGRVELAEYLDPARRASPWNARFAYPVQRYFVEYLKDRYGDDRFSRYLLSAISGPRRMMPQFAEVFGNSFTAVIADYQRDVRAGVWPPAE
jgi:hypothetical protein